MDEWYSFHPAYQSSIQSDKYQVLHKDSYFSWWWARSRLEHVEKGNKHIKKIVHQVGFIYKITRQTVPVPSVYVDTILYVVWWGYGLQCR